ncbi:MAG: two-CW domain-containing protein [Candidatus Thorarchaeota archaeon]
MLTKQNCWEIMNCGREPGGASADELGVCVATTETNVDGHNNGSNGGRLCWAVAGTLCGGEVQGEFANKMDNCIRCDFYHRVASEEKDQFVMYPDSMARVNCWEFMQCGRESGGAKTDDLGVCPAATETSTQGINQGLNGGRICWAIAGTFCGGKVQSEFASKFANCVTCAFYNKVLNEETQFVIHPDE